MSYSIGISAVALPEDKAEAWEEFDRLCKDKSEPSAAIAEFCAVLEGKYPQSLGDTVEPTDVWAFWPIIKGFGHDAGWLHFIYRDGLGDLVNGISFLAIARGFTVVEPAEGVVYTPAMLARESAARFVAFAADNIEQVGKSGLYGCYECISVSAAYAWSDKDLSDDGRSYLCPTCRNRSIIGDASGMPMTHFLLQALKDYAHNTGLYCFHFIRDAAKSARAERLENHRAKIDKLRDKES